MNISTLIREDLSDSMKSNLIDFMNSCFNETGLGENVYNRKDIGKIIVAKEDESILGHAIIFNRTIVHKSITYNIAGLGAVCTDPLKRSLGIGTKILEKVNTEINPEEYDIGLLFCHPNLDKFYSKTGWVKKLEGKIYYSENKEEKYERTSYVLPLKGKESLVSEWLNDNIHVGEGSW